MLNELKMEANYTTTENGGTALYSTGDYCLDLFATIGAMRHISEDEIIKRFDRAYAENPTMAMRILFFARDIRGGLGERRTFRIILKHLAKTHAESVQKNIWQIGEFGRWDDILELLDTACESDAISCMKRQLDHDFTEASKTESGEPYGYISLLGKWLPSNNTSNKDVVKQARYLARKFGWSDKQYRKTLVLLRKHIQIIENNLREKDYTFDYSKQPSRAMLKYRKAFVRNDAERYCAYIDDVAQGKTTMHTGALYPYDIVQKVLGRGVLSNDERKFLDVTWNALPDYSDGLNAICVIDGSESMYGYCDYNWTNQPRPADVALSLGIYFAEHTKGEFSGHFITFSKHPRLVEIQGQDIYEKVHYCKTFDEVANTNVSAVFNLILRTAINHHVPQEEMPEAIFIISDMEFDVGTEESDETAFREAKHQFEKYGYKLPEVIFWNVDSRTEQQPAAKDESGAILVSGCSPKFFEMVASGAYDPMAFMLSVVNNPRYAVIEA